MIEPLVLDEVSESLSHGDDGDGLAHWSCPCDDDIALCGADVSGKGFDYSSAPDEPDDCVVCVELLCVPCVRCGREPS